jgi:hypothetical protein
MDDYDVYSGSNRNRREQRDLNNAGAVRPPRAGPQIPPPQLSEDENEGSADDSCEHFYLFAFKIYQCTLSLFISVYCHLTIFN